jgi:hypothetical protein
MIMLKVIPDDIGKMSDAEVFVPPFLPDRYFAEKFLETWFFLGFWSKT